MDSCLPWLIKKKSKKDLNIDTLFKTIHLLKWKFKTEVSSCFLNRECSHANPVTVTHAVPLKNQQLPQPIYCVKITSLLTLRHFHPHFHSWSLNYQLEWVYQCESEVPWEESKSYFKAVSFSKQHIISDALITNPRDCNNWILKSLL